jgi:glycosyltransferase involved in cell wall biosynthesis
VVTYLGSASYDESWQALHFADVGIVVSAGPFMHNNESTKIYHYLRAGLPVVSESGFPNDHVVTSSGLGFLVENEDMEEMAERVAEAASAVWDRNAAIEYILDHHTWDRRAAVYDQVLRDEFANPGH